MIIGRYLSKEIIKTFLAVTLILTLIAASNKFVSLLGKAASGEFSPSLLLNLIGLYIPELLAFLLPLSLYLAILLSYGRFFADNEIPALLSCGFGWNELLKVGLKISLWVSLVVLALTLVINPILAQKRENALSEEETSMLMNTLTPGRFHSLAKERLVFYVETLSASRNEMTDVFIAEQPAYIPEKNEPWSVLTAKKGKLVTDPDTQDVYLLLEEGTRYEGMPGGYAYNQVSFKQFGRLIEPKGKSFKELYHRTRPTQDLWDSPNFSDKAELQWRLSIPISTPLLALLAVALSKVPPRAGRFARVFPGILIFIVYYNFLTMSRRWVESGTLSPWIGVWWVHVATMVIALMCFVMISGNWWSIKRKIVQCLPYSK